jgi:hypothetical protein
MSQTSNLDGFLAYIRERERIRLLRLAGAPYPWTTDPILGQYKFTNVRRFHDRTTQRFWAQYQLHARAHQSVALYNCGVYRYHGTISFMEQFGWQEQHDTEYMIDLARKMLAEGKQVYTGAYIVTNGGRVGFKESVVAEFLKALAEDAEYICHAMEREESWKTGFEHLILLPGFGGQGFMAKEVLQDYLLWRRAAGRRPLSDETSWTPVGPGARRGLNRLAGRPLRYQQKLSLFIGEIRDIWQKVDRAFDQMYGEHLTMHDLQFCLCEFDKYERVRLGEGRPRSRYVPTRQ